MRTAKILKIIGKFCPTTHWAFENEMTGYKKTKKAVQTVFARP